jgi:hypothetical protein
LNASWDDLSKDTKKYAPGSGSKVIAQPSQRRVKEWELADTPAQAAKQRWFGNSRLFSGSFCKRSVLGKISRLEGGIQDFSFLILMKSKSNSANVFRF